MILLFPVGESMAWGGYEGLEVVRDGRQVLQGAGPAGIGELCCCHAGFASNFAL